MFEVFHSEHFSTLIYTKKNFSHTIQWTIITLHFIINCLLEIFITNSKKYLSSFINQMQTPKNTRVSILGSIIFKSTSNSQKSRINENKV